VVNYHSSPEAAEAVAEKCRSLGVRAICVKADVLKPESVAQLFGMAVEEYGGVDIVMSNSGIEHFDDIPNVKGEDIDRVFGVNVKGQFMVAQQAFAHVRENGRVILMSSISAVWVASNPLPQSIELRLADTIPRAYLVMRSTPRPKPPSKVWLSVWPWTLALRTSPSIASLQAVSRVTCSRKQQKITSQVATR
jgi:NAD(P)-dependent dehydrogenase (short-subunit alcohol dehydrogenase family)